jgi:hypothetical protein
MATLKSRVEQRLLLTLTNDSVFMNFKNPLAYFYYLFMSNSEEINQKKSVPHEKQQNLGQTMYQYNILLVSDQMELQSFHLICGDILKPRLEI